MVTLYDIKPEFQRLLRPVAGRLAIWGVTPNGVTLAALGLSVAAGGTLSLFANHAWAPLLLPVVLLLRMALNALDGMLAREHDMLSPLGAQLNELGDVLSDVALYLPLMRLPGISPAAAVAFVGAALLTEVAGLAALQAGASRRYDGPFGKSDRALVVGALGLLLGCGVAGGPWSEVLVWGCALAALLTVVNRVRAAVAEVAEGA